MTCAGVSCQPSHARCAPIGANPTAEHGELETMSIHTTKSIEQIRAEQIGSESDTTLPRVLGSSQLVMLGVGAVIGTGIFVLTGQAAAANAGPAIVISMVVAGLASVLAALCY